MWAITSYFNPVGYRRRLSNYRTFRANLAVPLVAVELSFDGRFELTDDDADILIQLSGVPYFGKKSVCSILQFNPSPRMQRILRCDVIFERPDWMDEAEQKLSEASVVQLYSELVDLGPDGYRANVQHHDVRLTRHSIVSAINSSGLKQLDAAVESGKDIRQPFPFGMAWAARRKILEGHGLYDAMIIGGGDRAMVHAMYGQFEVPLYISTNPGRNII